MRNLGLENIYFSEQIHISDSFSHVEFVNILNVNVKLSKFILQIEKSKKRIKVCNSPIIKCQHLFDQHKFSRTNKLEKYFMHEKNKGPNVYYSLKTALLTYLHSEVHMYEYVSSQ